MTSLRKHLVLASLVAGLGIAAHAQTAPTPPAGGPGPQAHGRHDPARMAERMQARLAELKQKLQLTSAQEPAWTSYTTALRPQGQPTRPDPKALAALPTPDRLDQMRALRSQRDAEMDRRAEATKAFYAQLTPEQKKTFDAETARMFARHGEGRGHHRG
jgi:Spy/CpxP family protein refolding chaperone